MATLLSRLNTSKTEGRITFASILGLIAVPLIVAGVLVWGLWNPADRLSNVTAAIVNNDEPVTVNGQLTPLGRLLSAGLVEGNEDDTNYNWVLTNEKGAQKGLADGSYVAVVTIPEDFSKNATSSATDGPDATQALIDVQSTDKSRLVDDAITTAITNTAVSMLNQTLTTAYLENMFLGFTTLGEKLGEAADGAQSLSTGLYALSDGANQLSAGAQQYATGMWTFQQKTAALPAQTQQLADGAAQTNAGAQQVASGLTPVAQGIAGLAQNCQYVSTDATFCGTLSALSGGLTPLAAGASGVAQGTAGVATGSQALATGMTELSGGVTELATGATGIATGVAGIASGVSQTADGSAALATGLDTAVENIPAYSEEESKKLAGVITDPVAVADAGTLNFGASSTPLYIVLALWLGALATFIAAKAVPQRLLESTRSSLSLTTRTFIAPALIGAGQGVVVATIIAFAQGFDFPQWLAVAGVSALIGIVFAAVNQALVAVFGGFGRLVALAVGILILVTGVVSTVPPILVTALGFTPATDAITSLQAVISHTLESSFAGSITALVLWLLGSIAVTAIAIANRRHVSLTRLSKETQQA